MNAPQITFTLSTLVMVFLLVGLGVWITEGSRYFGILIDSRKKMSVSRFQLVMWTLLIASTIVTYAVSLNSVGFELPTEVWALLGISVGSAAGSVIVKGNKAAQTLIHNNTTEAEASFKDLFKGEEDGDKGYVDIAKVQMFFFTLIALCGYSLAIWHWLGELPMLAEAARNAAQVLADFSGGDEVLKQSLVSAADAARVAASRFPEVSPQLVVILGISHTGYLTVKAAPRG